MRAPIVVPLLLVAAPVLAAPDGGPAPAVDGMLVEAHLEPQPVPFAEPFDVVIRVTRPASEPLRLPAALPERDAVRSAGPPRRRVTPLPAERAGEAPRLVEEIRVPFLALGLDDLKTPELLLTAQDGSTLTVPALPVDVEGPDAGPAGQGMVESTELSAGRRHRLYDVADSRPWVFFGSFASSALALWALRVLDRRRRFGAPPAPVSAPAVVDRPPAHVVALARLEALLAEGHLARGEVAVFVPRLMDEVLRGYLEDRYQTPAGRRTTRELCEGLLGLSAPGLDVARVRGILEAADLVKFARADMAVEAAHRLAGEVRALIDATAERSEPAPGRGGSA